MDEFEEKLKELDKKIMEGNKEEKNIVPTCTKCGSTRKVFKEKEK